MPPYDFALQCTTRTGGRQRLARPILRMNRQKGRDPLTLGQPCSAARVYVGEPHVLRQVLRPHASRWNKAHLAVDLAESLQRPYTAHHLGGEELQDAQPFGQRRLDLRGRRHPRNRGHSAIEAGVDDRAIEPRRDDEPGAGGHRPLRLIDREHRSGANQELGQLRRQPSDRFRASLRAERDLRAGQPALQEGLAKRQSILRSFQSDDGNHPDRLEFFQDVYASFHSASSPLGPRRAQLLPAVDLGVDNMLRPQTTQHGKRIFGRHSPHSKRGLNGHGSDMWCSDEIT